MLEVQTPELQEKNFCYLRHIAYDILLYMTKVLAFGHAFSVILDKSIETNLWGR
jgi:hypothetical protein